MNDQFPIDEIDPAGCHLGGPAKERDEPNHVLASIIASPQLQCARFFIAFISPGITHAAYYYHNFHALGTLFHQIRANRANPLTKLFERGRRACAPCQSQAFCETYSQHLSLQKFIRSQNIWLLKSIFSRNYSFRICVITLRSLIRVRCV